MNDREKAKAISKLNDKLQYLEKEKKTLKIDGQDDNAKYALRIIAKSDLNSSSRDGTSLPIPTKEIREKLVAQMISYYEQEIIKVELELSDLLTPHLSG